MLKDIKNYDYQNMPNFDFKALCDLLFQEQCDLAAIKIKTLIKQLNLDDLAFDKHSYARNIVINNQHYWLGFLNWDKGAKTRIHGHPEQAFVYVINGRLSCRNFNKKPLVEIGSSELTGGKYRYNKGIKGKMDNYIHQISATQKSVSLHFYSDDPTKGEVFDI